MEGAGSQTKEAPKTERENCICYKKEQAQLETGKFQIPLIISLGFFCQVCIQDP